VITDNRLEASGDSRESSLLTGNPSFYSGDFVSPEQIIPPEGIVDQEGNWIPWEACITMNEHWGYCAADHQWKPSTLIVRKLAECVSKGGNLLLNVGPDAKGRIPEASLKILSEVGAWMGDNGEGIYGCGPAGLPKPEWGYYTSRGHHLYAHIFEDSIGPIALDVPPSNVGTIRLLSDGSEIKPIANWATSTWPDMTFVNFGAQELATVPLPDPRDTVIEITRTTA
jgi:alpha-L-fucosidase